TDYAPPRPSVQTNAQTSDGQAAFDQSTTPTPGNTGHDRASPRRRGPCREPPRSSPAEKLSSGSTSRFLEKSTTRSLICPVAWVCRSRGHCLAAFSVTMMPIEAFQLSGDVDLVAVRDLEPELRAWLCDGGATTIDMTEVTFVDSTALNMLA